MNAPTRRWKGGPAIALGMALLLPILYVLSIGPAAYLVRATGPSPELEEAAQWFYFPVVWLHENTPLHKPLNAYVEFWEDLS